MDEYERAAAELLGVGGANVGAYYPAPGQMGVGGANVQPMYPGVGAPVQQVAQVQQRAVQYSPAEYSAGEVSYLGFGSSVIPAGSAGQTVQISTIRPFTPQQMRFPSTVQGLLVKEVKIDGTNLFANSSGVPCELLSEVSNIPSIDWMTIDPASGCEMIVANPTGVAKTLTGAFWGTAVRK